MLGASLGDSQASVNLGYMYYYGRCGEQVDFVRAYQCYAQATLLADNPEAYWKLGDLYAGGRGVDQSDSMAWRMYVRAYEKGKGTSYIGRAAHHVADYLMAGIDGVVEPDPERALLHYTEAEIGYRQAIQSGLTYYQRCLEEAIEGQGRARKAIVELRKPGRWDE